METVFSKILSKEIFSECVYETEHVYAFLSIEPVHHGHTLVISKNASENIFDISLTDWQHITEAVHFLAPRLMQALHCDGLNIAMNNGAAADQEVFHAHVHIIPRFQNDTKIQWFHDKYAEGQMKEIGEKIRKCI
jgi:histidine triad (HIT) family protein